MMKIKHTISKGAIYGLAIVAILMATASNASAQVLFTSALDNGTGWDTNESADTNVTFGYDYSADFIPEAPHTAVPSLATTGIKVEANQNLPTGIEFLTIFPTGQNFTGNYQLRFDAWTNFSSDDVHNNDGAGTTEFIGGGIGYNGTSSDADSGAQIIATNEAGSGSDWRALEDGVLQSHASMAAGTRNANGTSYYSDFLPQVGTPVGQSQIDTTGSVAGSPGFQWITFELTNTNGMVSVDIEKPDESRLNITTMDCSDGDCTTDGNISLFYGDFFTSVTGSPGLTFGLFDNVVVTAVTAGLDGDYNDNGVVDAVDYTVWLDNLGAVAGTLPNDADGGVIAQAQYDTWKANFGNSIAVGAGSPSGAIPEPTSAVLFLIASVATIVARRRGN